MNKYHVLTPSDQVLLATATWTVSEAEGRSEVFTLGTLAAKVEDAIVAAVLANLRAGNITVTPVVESQCFGLVKRTVLFGDRTARTLNWPLDALEGSFAYSGKIGERTYEWLEKTVNNPWARARQIVTHSLVRRGILVQSRVRTRSWGVPLWILSIADLVAPDSLRVRHSIPRWVIASLEESGWRAPAGQRCTFGNVNAPNLFSGDCDITMLRKQISRAFSRRETSGD